MLPEVTVSLMVRLYVDRLQCTCTYTHVCMQHVPLKHTSSYPRTHSTSHPPPPPPPTHTHTHTHTQNSPVKFQVILVATGYDDESLQVRLDIAEQFAQEKNLKLVKCIVTDPASVESTFSAIIETIMSSWEGSQSVSGRRVHT